MQYDHQQQVDAGSIHVGSKCIPYTNVNCHQDTEHDKGQGCLQQCGHQQQCDSSDDAAQCERPLLGTWGAGSIMRPLRRAELASFSASACATAAGWSWAARCSSLALSLFNSAASISWHPRSQCCHLAARQRQARDGAFEAKNGSEAILTNAHNLLTYKLHILWATVRTEVRTAA